MLFVGLFSSLELISDMFLSSRCNQ